MANSTAGVPFSIPVGAALLGLANLFAQQPQAAAIGYTIYAIAGAGPFMFPDYNTTAAKIKNLTSNFHIADYSSVLSDLLLPSNEFLAETSTVLVTENSAIRQLRPSRKRSPLKQHRNQTSASTMMSLSIV
jgi:hypothetical protein